MKTQETLPIERIVAHIVEINLGFTYSTASLNKGRAIIWEVEAGDHIGIGENRLRGVITSTRRSFKSNVKEFIRTKFTKWVDPDQNLSSILHKLVVPMIGADAQLLESILFDMPLNHRKYIPRWIREGLSIALYDLVGKARGIAVKGILGGGCRDKVPGMPVIHVAAPEVMAQRAILWVDAGYRYLKVKIQGDYQQDIAAVKHVREAAGPEISIQIDCNNGYTDINTASKAIKALSEYHIDCFEDMLVGSIEQFAQLRHETGAKIMVDGQAWWPHVLKVIKAGAADVINHHPNNQGGLALAMLINAAAKGAGLETAIGSCGFFGIQNSAFQMLSSVIGEGRPCEDIGLTPYYSGPTQGEYNFNAEPSVIKETYPIKEGTIQIPNRPGLGIELDRDKLEHFCIDRFEFNGNS